MDWMKAADDALRRESAELEKAGPARVPDPCIDWDAVEDDTEFCCECGEHVEVESCPECGSLVCDDCACCGCIAEPEDDS